MRNPLCANVLLNWPPDGNEINEINAAQDSLRCGYSLSPAARTAVPKESNKLYRVTPSPKTSGRHGKGIFIKRSFPVSTINSHARGRTAPYLKVIYFMAHSIFGRAHEPRHRRRLVTLIHPKPDARTGCMLRKRYRWKLTLSAHARARVKTRKTLINPGVVRARRREFSR